MIRAFYLDPSSARYRIEVKEEVKEEGVTFVFLLLTLNVVGY